jgi:hypothetical protein
MVNGVIGSMMHQFPQAHRLLWAAADCKLHDTI